MVASVLRSSAAGRWRERASSGPYRYLAAALIFVAVLAATFAPLLPSLSSEILNGNGDARNAIRGLWLVQHSDSTPFTLDRDPFNGAPEGYPLVPPVAIASPLQPAFMWALAPVVGTIAVQNVFTLLGFVLTSFAAFVFLDRLGFGFLPSLFGGYVIAFNPWSMERAIAGAPAFNHGWCLILLLAALVRLRRSHTLKDAALAGAAYGICFLVAAYFGLIGAALILAFLVVELVSAASARERVGTLKRLGVMAGVTVIPLLPAVVAFALDRSVAVNSLDNPIQQLERLAAAPFASYLLPDPRHPVLGGLLDSLRPEDRLHEKVLFFGYVTIALAVAGLFLLVRRRALLTGRQRTAMTLAAVSIPIAFLMSLPRTIDVFGVTLYMPSYLIGSLTSFYRVYARVGYVVGIALALLAAAALAALLRRRGGPVIVLALFALVAFEYLPGTLSVVAIDKPPAYDAWLARQPRGVVAHYPLPTDNQLAIALAGTEYYNQRFTRQPNFALFGAGIGGTREEAIRLLARYVPQPIAWKVLAAEGVRYVALHDDIYRKLGQDPPLPLGPPFKHLRTFGPVRIYGLEPRPDSHLVDKILIRNAPTLASLQDAKLGEVTVGPGGFNPPERYHGVDGWRWMAEGGELTIVNPYDTPRRFLLTGKTFANGKTRTVEFQDDSGRRVATMTSLPYETGLRMQPIKLQPGTTHLKLYATPWPERLAGDVFGSIFLSPIKAIPLPDVSLRAR
jgi:hypothetical protein